MKINILTLFPEMFRGFTGESIIKRALEKNLLEINVINIRDFCYDKHKQADDKVFGGGAGMLMKPEPLIRALNTLGGKVIYTSPQGVRFDQKLAIELSQEEEITIIAGHYEGIDERVLEEIVTDYVSIGDYVLTGGELPAMVMMDSISRMVPGVLNNQESGETESFAGNLLEYPQYSRPEEWHGKKVPEVLMSGHHANIEKWRREQSIYRTAKRRPDLLKKADLTNKEWNYVRQLRKQWKEEEE